MTLTQMAGNNNNNNTNKRKSDISVNGSGESGLKNKKLNNIKDDIKSLVSLLTIDREENVESLYDETVAREEKFALEVNFAKNSRALHEQYEETARIEMECLKQDSRHFKKSRSAAVAAIAAIAAAAEDAGERGENSKESPVAAGGGGQQRRLWVKDRSQAWWDQCNSPDFPEAEFKKAFRMRRDTFNLICDELNSVVAKEDTMLRNAIPVQQRVAVCIWRLATGEPLRLVSKRFGLGISTCHKLVLEVCAAIKSVLMPKYLQWPNEEVTEKTKMEYEAISGIPDVVGAMYTTHIPIIAPKINVTAYYNKRHTERNQKTSYSITVQGVVNTRGVFTDVCIGWPGSLPDEKVLEQSALYQRANRGVLNGDWIVGSSGYPLTDWVLVPYTQQHLTWTQHAFNEKIADIQNVAKEAFARLKGRWSCLQKRTEVKLQDLPVVLGACCVLHNICEMRNEEVDDELKFQLVDDEMLSESTFMSKNAMQARDNIAHNLLHHGLAGTAFL